MAIKSIVNPKDTSTIIGLTDAINEIKTSVGFLKNSGLFTESLTYRDAVIETINESTSRGMLGFTSRRERNAVKQTKAKGKSFAVQIPYMKTIGEVTKEDIYQVAKDWESATEEQVMDLYIERLTAMRESVDNALEYIYWTGAQGQTRDPFDGSVVLDIFAVTGVTRPTKSFDLSDTTLNLLAEIAAFRNEIASANKRNSQVGNIDIFVDQTTFSALVSHPSVLAAYQMAMQARGQEYLDKVPNIGKTVGSLYGYVSYFEWDGVRFIVAPQKFILEDTGAEADAVTAGEGFVVVRGVRDGYRALFSQSNSLTDSTLAQVYAKRSAIIDDAYFEFTVESAPIAYSTTPELLYKVEFTLPTP